MIVLAVKASKFKAAEDSYKRDLELKDLTISEMKVDLKSSKMTEDELTSKLAEVNSYLNEVLSSLRSIKDKVPEKFNGILPDLSNKKQFMSCWLKLQNEAFANKLLKLDENGNIELQYYEKC
jgi:vacuolar-type H+-ATPase subunit I/STV1